ncbi:MAG: type II toxin-antitoxin system HipA family toxin, partial [Gammaproteobacteria bacterium]|nr:type II toxin-antitoxin system HipA family toxin [Gammaproteobacteria bacterium]
DSPWVNSHQMSVNGKRDDFNRDDLLSVGSLIGNFKKESQQIIEQVMDVVSEWKSYSKKADVFEPLSKEISKNVRLKI